MKECSCTYRDKLTIAENAGEEGAIIVGKLLEETNEEIGYDA